MEALIVLVVLAVPVVVLSGLIIGIVALQRSNVLRRRIAEIEQSRMAGDPLGERMLEVERRLEALERGSGRERPADQAEFAAPVVEPPQAPHPEAVPPLPPVREERDVHISRADTAAAKPEVTVGSETAGAAPPAARATLRVERPRIDWERWIGIRGAAAAGGVVLALASLLFFQYSIEHGLISPLMRVILGVIVGLCCLVGSEWLVRRDQAPAANALAGAGVVILYGAIWAAQNYYGLIGAAPAFALMVMITAACVALAVRRSAMFIAVLGLLGGFATPLLVASEMDSPAALFGYILLLDLALLWLARARGWPLLAVLSLVGTALHQGLWILLEMDAERGVVGLVILAVFGVTFLLFGGGSEESHMWRATRAGGVAIPFAFAFHFAGTARLAEDVWPLGGLLLILGAGACWLEKRGSVRGAAVAAAGAGLGIMGLWYLGRQVTPPLAWRAVVLCLAMAALFTSAAKLWGSIDGVRGLRLAALVSAVGFAVIHAFTPADSQVIQPWPWVAAWIGFGGLLLLNSNRPEDSWPRLVAGLSPAWGLSLAVGWHVRGAGAVEPSAWVFLAVGFAAALQVVAILGRDGRVRLWTERTAGVTALAMMPVMALLAALRSSEGLESLAAVLVLGLLGALASTRMRSGLWLLASIVATALFQTIVCVATFSHDVPIAVFILLAASAVLFAVWPALVPAAFRHSRAGWWGAALAGPLWFPALYAAWTERWGDDVIGLLPVALAAVTLGVVLWVRPRLGVGTATRRTVLVWYLAVVLCLVSVAIPLQLEKEWITIGWALNGLAVLILWVRLDHPGLKALGLALLGAATVRLIGNPAVFSYHVRGAMPVFNWLSYTYLVPAAALVLAYRQLRTLEVDRLTDWEASLYPSKKPFAAAGCGLAAVAVVFVWINLAIADIFATGPNLEVSFQRIPARDATTSVAWAIYALALLAIGVRSKSGSLRWLSLAILVLTLGKVFLHDLGELRDLYRVASLVGLAVSLIIVSLIYQRFVFGSARGVEE